MLTEEDLGKQELPEFLKKHPYHEILDRYLNNIVGQVSNGYQDSRFHPETKNLILKDFSKSEIFEMFLFALNLNSEMFMGLCTLIPDETVRNTFVGNIMEKHTKVHNLRKSLEIVQ